MRKKTTDGLRQGSSLELGRTTTTHHILSPLPVFFYSCIERSTYREKRLRGCGMQGSSHQPTLSHFVPFPSTPGPTFPPRCFPQESLVVNMMRGRYCLVLGTQSPHSSQGLGSLLASSAHSDHVLILLAHFQDLTASCLEELAPTTDFPSDPAGGGQLTAGYHSCDQFGDFMETMDAVSLDADLCCQFLVLWAPRTKRG